MCGISKSSGAKGNGIDKSEAKGGKDIQGSNGEKGANKGGAQEAGGDMGLAQLRQMAEALLQSLSNLGGGGNSAPSEQPAPQPDDGAFSGP